MLGSLQQDALVLLCLDDAKAPIVRGVVDVNLFGGPYRVIAERAYDYLDKFKKAPGLHLPNLLSDKLEGDNAREAELYDDILDKIYKAKDGINADFVMSQLETLIKRQSLRSIAVDLAKALQRDTEASLEEAEQLLAKANRNTLSVFDPGTCLADKSRALAFLDTSNTALPTGIPELDRRGFGPSRRELFLAIANAKAGKSWFLIHLAKMALGARVKVCHLTLEMSESQTSQRYFQTLHAVSKRQEPHQGTRFRSADGKIVGFSPYVINPKLSLEDPQIREKLEEKIDRWAYRKLKNIHIKQFPTGTLTMGMLTAYLDNLQATKGFTPDVLVVDYPDLMKLDKDNYRLSIDELFKDLRGLAVARNMAVVAVSQAHRAAAKAKAVGVHNVAEAYSKIAHADVIITYTQTEAEHKLGLARLHVTGRNDSDGFYIVLTQQYGIGQFALDSHLMTGSYFDLLPKEDDQ